MKNEEVCEREDPLNKVRNFLENILRSLWGRLRRFDLNTSICYTTQKMEEIHPHATLIQRLFHVSLSRQSKYNITDLFAI
jgi:hypothetical protein